MRITDTTNSATFRDPVTGRHFDTEYNLDGDSNWPIYSCIRKAIEQEQFSLHNGDSLFQLLVNSSDVSRCLAASSTDEPNFREAVKGPERDEWIKAIFKEIDGCLERETFTFVPKKSSQNRGRLVTSKWVLKKKYKSNMELDKYKARVVARGFTQTKGVDFNSTTATTARSASWRILAGELKEKIFMEQFPYLKEYMSTHRDVAEKLNYEENSIIELRKPLYGLKQSGAC